MGTFESQPPAKRDIVWLRIGQGGLALSLVAVTADFINVSRPQFYFDSCFFPIFSVAKLLMAMTGTVIVTLSWRQGRSPSLELLRKIAAGTLLFGACAGLFLSPIIGAVAQLVVYLALALFLLQLSRLPPDLIGKLTLAGLSTLVTFVLVGILLELVLRSDYSKLHLFGVYGGWPTSIRPSLNSHGYRDVAHSLAKPPGIVRILVLGDSLTWGEGVADDQVYTNILARLAGPQAEIINIARRGWSTADELSALEGEGLAYDPDIVIIGVVSNDPAPLETQPSGQQPEWVCFRCFWPYSDLFRFLDYQLNRIGDQLGSRYSYMAWENDLYNPSKPYWSEWQQTVREFGDLVKSRHIPTYAVMLVEDDQAPETGRKYSVMTREFARDGFIALDLWDDYSREFASIPYKKLCALPNNCHPGSAVQAFYAREIWRVLQPEVQLIQFRLSLK